MEFIFMLFVYFVGILFHELGHVVYYWGVFKDWPSVRFRKTNIQIIPGKPMSPLHKSAFLGAGIITGMFAFIPFFYIHSEETAMAMFAYFIASSKDFHTLFMIHVDAIKRKRNKTTLTRGKRNKMTLTRGKDNG